MKYHRLNGRGYTFEDLTISKWTGRYGNDDYYDYDKCKTLEEFIDKLVEAAKEDDRNEIIDQFQKLMKVK